MNDKALRETLEAVADGLLTPETAAARLAEGSIRYTGDFAALDPGRAARKGVPEVVYAPGKSDAQVLSICDALLEESVGRVIVSGASEALESHLREGLPGVSIERSGGSLVVGSGDPEKTGGRVAALCAGTSDIPVLEEAVAVAREMGVQARVFRDVGVAGLHRLNGPLAEMEAFDPDVLIVAAGMEGALPTVISALVPVPVVGLPTSTGYGLGGDGTAAILGMLQTCSPGLAVVNIDNGVGAGATAALIANRAARARRRPTG